jgi:hypothetical protein
VPKSSNKSMASCESSRYSFREKIKKSGRGRASKLILRDVLQVLSGIPGILCNGDFSSQ